MVLRVLLSLISMTVAVALIVEVNKWRKNTRLVSRKQKVFRLLAGFMIETVLLMIIFSEQALAGKDPLFQISYYSIAMMLSFLLVGIALLDIKEGLLLYREDRRSMFRKLIDNERKR